MTSRILLRTAAVAALLGLCAPAVAQAPASAPGLCADCVKAHMEVLAGDGLRGRGCATEDEHKASLYIEDELKKVGVQPAFESGMRQAVPLDVPRVEGTPALEAGGKRWAQGDDFLLLSDPTPVQGRFVRVTNPAAAGDLKGAIVFYDHAGIDRPALMQIRKAGAAAVLFPADANIAANWAKAAVSIQPRKRVVGVDNEPAGAPRIVVSEAMAKALRALPDGTPTTFDVRLGAPERRTTYNVVGVLHGTAPDADRHALLLSAHYDHLGVKGGVIFHGADDDASGTTAVLEFARILGQGARPRRTVYFALFGCEEEGSLGAAYFRVNPPGGALSNLAMNLEFEMVGNDDPKRPGVLMLTGWERSNLGPALAEHGAHIGPDLYPEQNFFQRSDNYALAQRGIVAQTVSAWAIPPSYHDPSDTLEHIDFPFMDQAIASMIGPIRWLADSDFQPQWNPGKKP